MRNTGCFKLIKDTKFFKKGEVVFIGEYRPHDGGQYVITKGDSAGHWFRGDELEPYEKNSPTKLDGRVSNK